MHWPSQQDMMLYYCLREPAMTKEIGRHRYMHILQRAGIASVMIVVHVGRASRPTEGSTQEG